MRLKNIEIREAANAALVPLWAVAEYLGRSESWMTRKLRSELSDDEKVKFIAIIRSIAEQGAEK